MNLGTKAEREQYERDGVTCIRNVVSPEWIETLKRGTARAGANPSEFSIDLTGTAPGDSPGESPKRSFWGDFSLWQNFEEFRRFIFDSPISSVTADVVGSNRIQLFYDYLLVKEPVKGTRTAWHQDYPYYPVDGTDICSVWVAIDRTNLDNGGLEYVAGSHRWGPRLDKKSFTQVKANIPATDQAELDRHEATVADLPDIDTRRADYEILSWDLEPGDVLVHHALAVHGAPANTANAVRRGYAVRWMYGDVIYRPRANPSRHIRSLIEDPAAPVAAGEVIVGPNFPVFPRT